MNSHRSSFIGRRAGFILFLLQPLACLTPPGLSGRGGSATPAGSGATPPPVERKTALDAWTAVAQMSPRTNIGNTLDNTTLWETGWGNPPITKGYIQSLARLGLKTTDIEKTRANGDELPKDTIPGGT
jgi:hypothetical protein